MTDEKAIEWLKSMKRGVFPFPGDLKTKDKVFDTAISALEERIQRENRIDEQIKQLSCIGCDRFGIDCGDCEVNDDDG